METSIESFIDCKIELGADLDQTHIRLKNIGDNAI
jgi:hypothetical protein